MMPRKNGYEVCEEIKSDPTLRDIYVVLLTAKGQQEDRTRGLSVGADEYVLKPFSPADVVQRVKELTR
jgi:DNA-binding response OmpR family regulator